MVFSKGRKSIYEASLSFIFLASAILTRNCFVFNFFIFSRFEKHIYLFLTLKSYYVSLEEAGFKC